MDDLFGETPETLPTIQYHSKKEVPKFQLKRLKSSIQTLTAVPENQWGMIRNLVFLEEANLLCYVSRRDIIVFSILTQKCIRRLTSHLKTINHLITTPDKKHLVSCSSDRTIKIWNINTGKCDNTLLGHKLWIGCLLFLPNSILISGSGDCTLKFWNLKISNEAIRTIPLLDACTEIIILNSFEKIACSSGNEILILNWNQTNSNPEKILHGHSQWIKELVAIEGEKKIMSVGYDKSLKIWDWMKEICLFSIWEKDIIVGTLVINDNEIITLLRAEESEIKKKSYMKYWILNKKKCEDNVDISNELLNNIINLQNQSFFATTGDHARIELWELFRN